MMKCVTNFGTYDVELHVCRYDYNNNLAITLWSPEEGPFATLTVNLPYTSYLPSDMAFVNTNNCPWAEEFIEEHDLGEPTGEYGISGFCRYPLYRFYLDKIEGNE